MDLKLINLRKKKKMSQEEIGKILNITQSTYQHYENNRAEPNIETLCKLADYYDVTLDYLVGRDYKNELGYLDEQDKKLIQISKELNTMNKINLIAYASGLLVGQK